MLKFIGFYDYTVILTYVSLTSAFGGMLLANREAFSGAILCLILSGICDAFDGTVARSKTDRTEDEKDFGIQLDSLCDIISFGVFPAFLCYCMGINSIFGVFLLYLYCICAVIRLAFFNVLEGKRQRAEGGCNKEYRGLPVTSISIIFPAVYLLRFLLPEAAFLLTLHAMTAIVAFLFVLDFRMKKPNLFKSHAKH